MRSVAVLLVVATCCYSFRRAAVNNTAITNALNSLVTLDNRTDNDVILNYQNMASHNHFNHDNAPMPLFTSVANSVVERATYKALNNLVSFYTSPDINTEEIITTQWNTSINKFIDEITSTEIMVTAWQFLTKQGLSPRDLNGFRNQLYNLWFTPYARNSVVGSSGFESVFVGEVSDSTVIRMNNWIRFYELEKRELVNYHGWFTKQNGIQISTQFSWREWKALQKSFLLNSSPEFEIAVYTLCALAGGECSMTIDNDLVTIHASTIIKNDVIPIAQIDECYTVRNVGKVTEKSRKRTTKKHFGPKDTELQALVDQMRTADVDKPAPSDIILNWGNKESGTQDESPLPLFTYVNETIFESPVYAHLINIYNKEMFTPQVCVAEPEMSGFRKARMQQVLDTFMDTEVFSLAHQYLQQKGVKEASDISTLKAYLFNLWFGVYSRCEGALGSSGWEHVFSGEWKGNEVDGQHNWVRFYLLEKAGKINYHGYYSYDGQLTGTFQYTWINELKKTGGFLIGTSPAFDFSLLTVCVLVHPGNNACRFTLDNYSLAITSYKQHCSSGTCLSTAYPTN